MSFLHKLFKDPEGKYLVEAQKIVEEVNLLENEFKIFSDTELKEKALALKQNVLQGQTLQSVLIPAFALAREAAKRKLNQRHFDTQMLGGIVLHEGKIVEMKTGEGKTLAATLPCFLNGLSGKGVHVVTVNDYLAKRDAVWMGQIYNGLGLTVGCIAHDSAFIYDPNYQEDKFKVQSSKFKVKEEDILGEKEKQRDAERDLRGSFKVIEDYLVPCSRKEAYEADITYGTNHEFGFDYLRDNMVFDIKQKVQRGFNFAIVDEVDSILIDEARTPLIISSPDLESSELYKKFSNIVPRLKKETDYEVDEKMKTVFLTETGMDNVEKTMGECLYEEKGMKNLRYLEESLKALVFFKKDINYIVKNGEVIIIDEFTGRIMPGRRYSGGLHQAIEAKERVQVQPESKILATVTFQNYFRMYSKLSGMTGTAQTSAEEFDKVYGLKVITAPTNKPLVRKDLQDLIFKTEKGKFQAIVNEVKTRNEKGQPILIGTRSVERNEYLSKLLDREGIKHEVLNAKNHQREGEIIAQAGRKGAVTVATNMAGRGVDIMLGGAPPSKFMAAKNKNNFSDSRAQSALIKNEKLKIKEAIFDNRAEISEEYKEWEKNREEVVALGGLFVLGTERHEARRIDNQLRGRSGRQGDAGESQFFLCLEDELLRIFGGDRLKSFMNMLKISEDQPIEAKMISNVIEKAQTKVEGMHFDSRKHILDYDDIIDKQRRKIYSQRDDILTKPSLREFILGVLKSEVEKIVDFNEKEKALAELKTIMPIENFETKEDVFAVCANLIKNKTQIEGENFENILRFVVLRTMDDFWTEHLVSLDHLQDSVRLRAYGGKDPLVEYKTESHKMFQALWDNINSQISRLVFKVSSQR